MSNLRPRGLRRAESMLQKCLQQERGITGQGKLRAVGRGPSTGRPRAGRVGTSHTHLQLPSMSSPMCSTAVRVSPWSVLSRMYHREDLRGRAEASSSLDCQQGRRGAHSFIRLLQETGAGSTPGRLRVLRSEFDGGTHRHRLRAAHESPPPYDGRLGRRTCTQLAAKPAN